MILSETMKNQEGLFAVTCFDVMQEVAAEMDKAFLDHQFTPRCRFIVGLGGYLQLYGKFYVL